MKLLIIKILLLVGLTDLYAQDSLIYIDTNPQDAKLFSSDTLVGHTPVFIPSSIQSLTIKKEGYETKVISREDLREKINLNYLGKEAQESFYKKDIFKVLIGTLVVLGGTTAYFKIKADKEFDDYQFSGDKKSLDNTRKYDLISGITFTGLQLNMGVLIYYLLIE